MKNRKLLLIVSLVLALTMSLGGTLAYLTDTDADVNTMVLGNVKIVQNEQQWNDEKTELVEFEQDKPLLPYVGNLGWENKEQDGGAYRRFTMSNVVDKYVTVTNSGNTDAYIRTIIAVEMGEYANVADFKYKVVGTSTNAEDGAEFDFTGAWKWSEEFVAQINGQNYMIMTATHQDAVEAKATTIPSLLQVYVNKDCDNDDLIKLDGNENGKLDVLVISQAVQSAGFEDADTALNEAFKAVSVEKAKEWFEKLVDAKGNIKDANLIGSPSNDGVNDKWPSNDVPGTWVSTGAELADAIAEGGKIALSSDVEIGKIDLTDVEGDVVIDGNNNKITTSESYGIETDAGKNVTISNAEIEMTKEGDYLVYAAGFKIANGDYNGATIKLENCKISMANGDWSYAVNMPASVKNLNLVIDNCELEGAIAVQCWGDNNTITITNSKLKCSYTTNEMYTSACVAFQTDGTNKAESNKLVVDNCEFVYTGVDNFNSTIYSVVDYVDDTTNTVKVTNCTYGEKVAAYTAE